MPDGKNEKKETSLKSKLNDIVSTLGKRELMKVNGRNNFSMQSFTRLLSSQETSKQVRQRS